MEPTPGSMFLEMARARIVVHLTGQITACLAALSDPMIWWRANDRSNAIGNLVLHCAGSTRYHIGHVVGGHDFVRDRDAEFERKATATFMASPLRWRVLNAAVHWILERGQW